MWNLDVSRLEESVTRVQDGLRLTRDLKTNRTGKDAANHRGGMEMPANLLGGRKFHP